MGVEPTIFRLEGGRLSHLATEAVWCHLMSDPTTVLVYRIRTSDPRNIVERCSYHYNPMLYQLS